MARLALGAVALLLGVVLMACTRGDAETPEKPGIWLSEVQYKQFTCKHWFPIDVKDPEENGRAWRVACPPGYSPDPSLLRLIPGKNGQIPVALFSFYPDPGKDGPAAPESCDPSLTPDWLDKALAKLRVGKKPSLSLIMVFCDGRVKVIEDRRFELPFPPR